LTKIQGNSIGGFNKDFQTNLFLKFTTAAAGRAWIKEISDEVAASSSAEVLRFNNQFSALRVRPKSISGRNEFLAANSRAKDFHPARAFARVARVKGLSARPPSPND
jgi:hypothetical protein